jgi:hypothetical protein
VATSAGASSGRLMQITGLNALASPDAHRHALALVELASDLRRLLIKSVDSVFATRHQRPSSPWASSAQWSPRGLHAGPAARSVTVD